MAAILSAKVRCCEEVFIDQVVVCRVTIRWFANPASNVACDLSDQSCQPHFAPHSDQPFFTALASRYIGNIANLELYHHKQNK
jgi:hypothetical protein